VDIFDTRSGIDDLHKRLLYEGVKDVVAFLEGVPLLEGVGFTVSHANAVESFIDGKIEEEEEIGFGCELFVEASDLGGVKSAHALIRHAGKVVAVEDDYFAGLEGGRDEGLDMLGAVLQEELEFFLGRETSGGGGLPEFGPVGAVGRFPRSEDAVALVAEPLGEEAGLSGLSGSVDSFENDEHGRGVRAENGRLKFARRRKKWRSRQDLNL
jgi:hypothetical protein